MNKFALIYLLYNVVFTLRCLIKAFRDDISTKTDCITLYTFRTLDIMKIWIYSRLLNYNDIHDTYICVSLRAVRTPSDINPVL